MCHDKCLNKWALGLAMGVLWGLSVLLMGVLALTIGYGAGFVQAVGTVYIGYKATLIGILIGTGLSFVDGFIGGFLIALFYNCFANCLCKEKVAEAAEEEKS